ncbi:pimeloyl-ACP methyl ester carboxylesterase [Rhodobium orientis]|uniref:Alpha/beta hydrolase n=1 Tax=Rhodobium orientis TaxID=34017 RepID=A0A327JSJ9_9HYPH|nr:alpha/beta hydrolase [Rhodobium orientis]MBB4302501.1 pimeloyl-ACP methyl ester carboxylesterase [Rhodobium orientis]MBK5949350.1 alpha/beta hydrolase [Rhodobium orientis]RAI28605.1 alpha/beta hydrolase [Rhodobium orientis]
MPFVTFEDARVSYKIDGNGPPLILVHGTGGNAETNWGALVERFARHWTVIRPDYSGSGATTDGGGALSAEGVAGQILAVADAAGAERFHLMGFSLGAAIAARIAGEFPDRVDSLVLLAGFQSAADSRSRLQFGLWRHLIATDREAMARLAVMTGFSPDALAAWPEDALAEAVAETLSGTDWPGMARQVDLDLSIDVSDSVRRIAAPTLVVGCTHDQMVPIAHSRALAGAIAGARYAELPTGHLAPMERPDGLADLVEDFLLRQP